MSTVFTRGPIPLTEKLFEHGSLNVINFSYESINTERFGEISVGSVVGTESQNFYRISRFEIHDDKVFFVGPRYYPSSEEVALGVLDITTVHTINVDLIYTVDRRA